jgi:biotin carboxyl carrier protein
MENQNNLKKGKITVEGVEYDTYLTKKYQERLAYSDPDFTKIVGFISGAIRDVYVKEGAVVKEGDVLLSLEAMKMKNQIKAPQNGRVKKIYVKVNEQVTKGQLLVELG